MAEHVGESQIDLYARSLFALLQARAGWCSTTRSRCCDPEEEPLEDSSRCATCSPTASRCRSRAYSSRSSARGFHTEHVEGFREDYAITLRHWPTGSTSASTRPCALAGPERTRIWRLYLRAARHGFDVGLTAVYQVRAQRPPRAFAREDPREESASELVTMAHA